MNHYEQRVEAKKERLAARSVKLSEEAQRLEQRASQMASVIPMGQPLMTDHYSYKRDRNYRDKIGNTFKRAHETHEAAQDAARRAETVGSGGISSDDPDAIDKLKEKLEEAERKHAQMVAFNKAFRKHRKLEREERILAIFKDMPEMSLAVVRGRCEPNCFGAFGFADYELTNSKGRINQAKERIRILEKRAATAVEKEVVEEKYTYREDPELNRVMFILPGKPSEDIRKLFKSRGFRWSPTNGAWQTNLTERGKWQASMMKVELDKQ